jgi:hypothetical protein
MNLDDVHQLLDQLDETIQVLAQDEREWIETAEAGKLCLIIGEIMGWSGSAYSAELPRIIGIRPATLSKFHKLKGSVTVHECRVLADRLRTYLRGLDQATKNDDDDETMETLVAPIDANLSFGGMQWVSVKSTKDIKHKSTHCLRYWTIFTSICGAPTAYLLRGEFRSLTDNSSLLFYKLRSIF